MLTKNTCVHFMHASSIDQLVRVVKINRSVICFEYIACANHLYEKQLQGHLKRTLNHKNYQQKVTKQFAVLKDSKGQFWKVKHRAKICSKTNQI
jgi:hypothetical protein